MSHNARSRNWRVTDVVMQRTFKGEGFGKLGTVGLLKNPGFDTIRHPQAACARPGGFCLKCPMGRLAAGRVARESSERPKPRTHNNKKRNKKAARRFKFITAAVR